jgi:uncharacterized pyridoxal phosphate-dependent enzyme
MVTYQDLQIKPFINASGTITTLGGSLMADEVLDAMRAAAGAFIDLDDLLLKASDHLAQQLGVPAAYICCGAASGMQLAAAACLTGTDVERVRQLPHTSGWRNEFVISTVDQHTFIHQGIEACGGQLVRVGTDLAVTSAEVIGGVNKATAAVVHFLEKQGKAQLEQVIAGVKTYGVPVIVDAAAELPPRSNLTELVQMGAALVVFSGGKALAGPQSSGLIVGTKAYVDAVRINASPCTAIGRGMKVGKEEILGLLTAVDRFLAGSDAADRQLWFERASVVAEGLKDVAGVRAYVMTEGQDASPDFAPRAYVDLDADDAARVLAVLADGDPPVVLRKVATGILIDPMTMQPGDEVVVAERLKAALTA